MKVKRNFLLFCPTHPRKNILNQIYGFILATKENSNIFLHTNSQIRIQHPQIKYYDWLEKKDYEELLKKIDFSLQVFHTESFCYGYVESMIRGIPAICSPCVYNNFRLQLMYPLIIENPDSVIEISKIIIMLSNITENTKKYISNECKYNMKKFAEENNHKLKDLMIVHGVNF